MNTSVEKFLEKLASDENLRKEMAEAEQNLEGKNPETIFNEILKPIINKAGFDFSFEDLQKMQSQGIETKELDDDALEEVAGGLFCFGLGLGFKNDKTSGACMMYGEDENSCSCIIFGVS